MGYQHNPSDYIYQQGPPVPQYQGQPFYSPYAPGPQHHQFSQGHSPYALQSPPMGQQHGPQFSTPTQYHGGTTPTPTSAAPGPYMQHQRPPPRLPAQSSTVSTGVAPAPSSPLANIRNSAAVPSSYMVNRMQKPSFDIPEELFDWWRGGDVSTPPYIQRDS